MPPLVVVQSQCVGYRLDHLLGRAAAAAALQVRVVLDRDVRQFGHLGAPQPRGAPAIAAEPEVAGIEAFSRRPQEPSGRLSVHPSIVARCAHRRHQSTTSP
ncbi:hypothetical protein GCM10023114_47330 [Mycolicibacterium sediminis]|uniref:Uncharacterized protein n=1 Tax=Mycolicibacterium sediminis TaxID=1286180 RepID=A0A7I7QMK7_9MYCO|nr:hypothetical protein MSEDJ_16100 [Mycolicibacterium sediminis]